MLESRTVRDAVIGGAAGTLATLPMTVFMQRAFEELPAKEQYPLPPRQITGKIGDAAGVWQTLSEETKEDVTLAAHFGYGGAAGAIYGAVVPNEVKNVATGTAFGLAVWAGSYLGLLPGLGILPSATQHPARRNALMIAAHVVWGGTLGLLSRRR